MSGALGSPRLPFADGNLMPSRRHRDVLYHLLEDPDANAREALAHDPAALHSCGESMLPDVLADV